MKMLVVDITAADAAGGRLGRYKVVERHDDGSLLLAPESVDEVIAETAEGLLNGDEFMDALARLDVAASQQPPRRAPPTSCLRASPASSRGCRASSGARFRRQSRNWSRRFARAAFLHLEGRGR